MSIIVSYLPQLDVQRMQALDKWWYSRGVHRLGQRSLRWPYAGFHVNLCSKHCGDQPGAQFFFTLKDGIKRLAIDEVNGSVLDLRRFAPCVLDKNRIFFLHKTGKVIRLMRISPEENLLQLTEERSTPV